MQPNLMIGVFDGNEPAFSFEVTGSYVRARVDVISAFGTNRAEVEVDLRPRRV